VEVGEGEQGFRVQTDGKAEDAGGASSAVRPVSVHLHQRTPRDRHLTYRRQRRGYGILPLAHSYTELKGFGVTEDGCKSAAGVLGMGSLDDLEWR
jgi:hypothetical protein